MSFRRRLTDVRSAPGRQAEVLLEHVARDHRVRARHEHADEPPLRLARQVDPCPVRTGDLEWSQHPRFHRPPARTLGVGDAQE